MEQERSILRQDKLIVEKIGTFVIQVTTEKTGIYKSAEPVEITLTVIPAKIPEKLEAGNQSNSRCDI